MNYDPKSITSIVEYAERLVGHSLKDLIPAGVLADPRKRRGSFGNAMEEYYFEYAPNSDGGPDFKEVGIELKTTPLKRTRKDQLVAKERLVLTMIDYNTVVEETFETSHLIEKAASILLVSYMWEPKTNPIDYQIVNAELWGIPDEDLPQIKADWETVVNKIRAGHAEDISGSDTLYLEACTKAANATIRRSQPFSDIPAKPRAWALKSSYMTAAQNKMLTGAKSIARKADEKRLTLLELVKKRFEPYFGMTEDELKERFELSRSKDLCARITRRILGVAADEKIEEFEKAGIKSKTIRLQKNGRPKEAVSFPAIDYFDLEITPFEKSDFYGYLQQRYLFVLYRFDGKVYRMSNVCFWQMPDRDLDEAKRCYRQMQVNVQNGQADASVGSTENRCCHVRPHGRNAADTRPQPHGRPVTKKSFWLNQSYLAAEIGRALRDS